MNRMGFFVNFIVGIILFIAISGICAFCIDLTFTQLALAADKGGRASIELGLIFVIFFSIIQFDMSVPAVIFYIKGLKSNIKSIKIISVVELTLIIVALALSIAMIIVLNSNFDNFEYISVSLY